MKYRKFGDTGLEVSEIGFGTWGIGGPVEGVPAYGKTDDQESKLALELAFDLGINLFDTSPLYGFGHSERLIGQVLGLSRDKVIITTKAGILRGKQDQDFSQAHLRKSLEESLVRLGSDYIDLFLLHNPPLEFLYDDPGVIDLLHAFRNEGKVRSFGVSVRSPNDGLTAVKEFGFKALEVNFNMLDQRALECGLLELCQKQNVGVIARTPLCFGFLTGAFSPGQDFGAGDHRSTWSSEQLDCWANGSHLFFNTIGRSPAETNAQTALRYCLSYPGVSTAIPGLLTRKHVEENQAASDLGALGQEEVRRVEEIYQKHSFFIRDK